MSAWPSMAHARKPNVYSYSDYRSYLSDHYAYAKENEYGFSFRVFSKRANVSSSNYLRLVIDGKRNLSPTMATQFGTACGLSGSALDFFCELVAYGQAPTTRERHRHYERLTRFRPFRAIRKLDAAQAAYHGSWYIPAIRELVRRADFVEDPKWIAAQLLPPISSKDATHALKVLLGLQLLRRDEQGRLVQTDALVSTGPGPLGHHIFTYHHAMLEHAATALDQLPREERNISSITVCVSQEKMLELERRVRNFRRDLLQLAELDNEPQRVVQVNLQLFPLSKQPQVAPPAPAAGATTSTSSDETGTDP
jgi:uncharacterized protein (TIGR02147 family)